MVISNVNQVVYNGDGITTAWPFTFPIIDNTDLRLTLINAAGARTDITSDYYVDMVNNTVYYPGYAPGAEPPEANQPPKVQSGEKLEIYRRVPVNQLAHLGKKWPFNVIEKGLDKLTMICQDIYSWIGRNIVGLTEDGTSWDARNLPISNVGGPVNVEDAATKDYVDRILNGFVLAGDSRTVPFDNVAQMKVSDIEAGQIAFTLGYHDINDGGAGVYNIRAKNPYDVDNGGSIIFLDNGNVAELITDGTVNVKQFGAYGDGTHDDTNAINTAYQKSDYNLYIPPGTYKGNFEFTMLCKNVYGADRHSTILIPADSAKPVVTWFGNSHRIDGMDAILSNLCIDCNATGATGLQIGYSDYTYGDVGYGWIHDIDVKSGYNKDNDLSAAGLGILFNYGTGVVVDRVYVSYFYVGIDVPQNHSVQLDVFSNCRFRFCNTGARLQSGHVLRWESCVFECNKKIGVLYRRYTNGGARSIFVNCWWEKNGWDTHTADDTGYASVVLDRFASLSNDVPSDVLFERCVICAHTQGDSMGDAPDAYDVVLTRGRNIVFDFCSFDSAGNTFNSHRFYFNKFNYPCALLVNCGTNSSVPTPTLYASFPALVRQNNMVTGFEYEFCYEGVEYSNAIFNVFTPIVFGKSTEGTATYERQVGRYTKVGNIVHFFIALKWTNYTGTGIMAIKGLPFDQNVDIGVPINFHGTLAGVTTGNKLYPIMSSNSINLFQKADDKSVDTAVTTGDGNITLCGTYMAQ